MERITLTINKWSNEELKNIKKEDYIKCELDIVSELGTLIIQYNNDKLSTNDYRWLLLEKLSEKHLLNTIHMIMVFNNMFYEDFFDYTEEQLKEACKELKEELKEELEVVSNE